MFVPDYESYLGLIGVDRLLPWPDEWEKFHSWMRERQAMVEAGLQRCPRWFQEELTAIDPRLRAWWDDWKQEWVIDRLQDAGIVERLRRAARAERQADVRTSMQQSAETLLDHGPFYLTVVHFQPGPMLQLDQRLLDMFKAADMQRFNSPEEYIAGKQDDAEIIQKANEQRGNEKVLEAIDSLSDKQLQQFIDVTEAVETGETIVAHGDDLKILETTKQRGTP